MIEIDTARYARVTRGRALKLLEAANLAPDKFTAHRNGTFTAKYKRDRQPIFASHRYEERKEKKYLPVVAENVIKYLSKEQRQDLIEELRSEMERAAAELEFERAAQLRDEIQRLSDSK